MAETLPSSGFSTELQDLLERFRQNERARLEHAKDRLRTTILPRLKQWGIAKVKAKYSGYGDSGCINDIAYLDGHDQPVNMDMVRPASDPDIERVLYEFLPAGFEINEGGLGTLTLDVAAGTVKLDHIQNELVSHASSREFFLK